LTKTTDSPESPSKPPAVVAQRCQVRRRLKAGTYSKEFDSLVDHWFDWHYYPLTDPMTADIFSSTEEAQKYIEEQQKSWTNFEYEIIILDK
jgi:hypothetical protein